MTETDCKPENPKKIKAVALVSGGLDSAVAAKLMMEQGIEVHALNFHSPFCTCSNASKDNPCGAIYFANKLDIPIKTISKGNDYLEMIKKPKFGYGKNMNPCIDCRIPILENTQQFMDEIGAEFVITGEVLGQRPKSQTMRAIKIIEAESSLAGKILRPLSAKLLPATPMELEGIVDREKLLKIQGRRRNVQVELGRKFNLIEQYCAGGGCQLTDKNFAAKLRDYFAHTEIPEMKDMKFLKLGRHFRYQGVKMIIGRNEGENECLTIWARPTDILMVIKDVNGPTTLIEVPEGDSTISQEHIEIAAQITLRYSDSTEEKASVAVKDPSGKFSDFAITRLPNTDEIMNGCNLYVKLKKILTPRD